MPQPATLWLSHRNVATHLPTPEGWKAEFASE